MTELRVTDPVAVDSKEQVWLVFNNRYSPTDYFTDGKGRIRHHHFGEGDYDAAEALIRDLLKENGATSLPETTTGVSGAGVEAAPDFGHAQSPETYLGYRRTERFGSLEEMAQDRPGAYHPPIRPRLNQWGLSGVWIIGGEDVALQTAPGRIMYRFHSRDLHLVLAPAMAGKPVRFKVTVDGVAPGDDHGTDTGSDGTGAVREARLYQLIRQSRPVIDRTFEIEFLDPGVQAFAFTFG